MPAVSPWAPHAAAIAASLVMSYICIHPILAFVRRGWRIRREEVLASLTREAKRHYLHVFLKQDSRDPNADFDAMYFRRYGRYRLIVPSLVLCAALLPLTFLVGETAVARILVAGSAAPAALGAQAAIPFLVLPGRAVAAVAGAYLWIAYTLITSAAVYNLPPPMLLNSALRLIIAAPLGYALGGLAAPGLGTFLAFAIGVFPLQTVQVLLQRVANNRFGLELGEAGTPDQVRKIDGVDPPTADRLQETGITTISQLAYCDPVQLALQTNIRFDAVIDIVDQALARLYLGDKLDALMPRGVRGAIDMGSLLDSLVNGRQEERERAAAALTALAAAAALTAEALVWVFEQIASDPYARFIHQVWGVSDGGEA